MVSAGSNVRLSLVGVTGTTAEIIYTIDTTGRYEDGYLIVFNENNTEVSRTSSFRAYGNSSGSQNVTGIASGHLYIVKFYSSDLGVYSESTVEIDLRSGDPAYAISSSSTATSVNIIVSPISSATMETDGAVVVESVSDGIKESVGYKSSDPNASITLVGLDQNTEYTLSVTYYDPGLASSVTNTITISTSELGAKQGPKLYGGVSGDAEEITKLYGSILGESTKITKLYGGVGKNLFDNNADPIQSSATLDVIPTGIKMSYTGSTTTGEYYNYCAYVICKASEVAGKKLTLSFDFEGHTAAGKYRAYIGLSKADGSNYIQKSYINQTTDGHYSVDWTVVEEEDRPYIRVVLYLYSGSNITRTSGEYVEYTNVQLEVGDETAYEPFVGSKLIHVSRPDKVYGYVTYYTDVNHTTTTTEPLKSQTEVNSLAGNSGSWSATVNGETVANSDITGVVLGSLVSTIPDWFLADCDNLTSLEMDKSSVTSIPNRFMAGCTSITDGASVVLPSSLTSIGDYFMYGCNGLTSAPAFLGSLTTIGRAFMNDCTNIKAIMLPSSLTSIGQEMLSVCNNLESVYVGSLSADIAAADSSGIYSFSVLTSGVPAYTNGIKILGDSSVIDEWTTKFPNRTSTPFRKLVSSESDGVFMIMADETGTMVIKNRWTTNILVKNKTQDTEEVSVAPMYTTNVQVNASDMVVVSESSIDSTFRSWATNTLNYTPPFVTGVSSHIISMPAMNSFTIDTAGTTAGDFFFAGFNNGGSLTSLPAGSFDTGSITTAGSHFFMSFNVNGKLTSLPVGSFDTSNITTVDDYFFSHFNNRGSITSLPANSFDISNISVAHNYFFMSFNYGGELTSLPAGSFDTGSITTAGDFFFAGFNAQVLGSPSIIGKLASLPIGSFNTRNITTVGTNCFMEFNYGGCLPKSTSSYHTNFINPSSSSIDAYYGTGSSGSTTAVSIASGAPFYYYQN